MARTPDTDGAEFVRRVREPRAESAEPGRHRARRSAMMLLYTTDLVRRDINDALADYERDHGFPMPEYGAYLARGVHANLPQLDGAIQTHLSGWTIQRLGAVERAILRIGAFEFTTGDVPPPVVVDEAVELAKRYATPEAAKLVNGVLGAWIRTPRDATPFRAATEEE